MNVISQIYIDLGVKNIPVCLLKDETELYK